MMMICNKHPDHTLHPGICSSCLREKLANIESSTASSSYSRNRSTRVRGYSFSPSPSQSSSAASSSAFQSPRHEKLGQLPAAGDHGLRKSRSLIAFASRKTRKMMMIKNKSKKNKKSDGFWSKLVGGTKKTDHQGVFLHSKTSSVKER